MWCIGTNKCDYSDRLHFTTVMPRYNYDNLDRLHLHKYDDLVVKQWSPDLVAMGGDSCSKGCRPFWNRRHSVVDPLDRLKGSVTRKKCQMSIKVALKWFH